MVVVRCNNAEAYMKHATEVVSKSVGPADGYPADQVLPSESTPRAALPGSPTVRPDVCTTVPPTGPGRFFVTALPFVLSNLFSDYDSLLKRIHVAGHPPSQERTLSGPCTVSWMAH